MATSADRRADPARVVPGCRAVVVLAMNYWRETPAPASRPKARIARYARARDYHRVLGAKAREVASWLESSSGAPARAFVDTGPILERAWAERAGLGWIGKNANLLTRDLGSWILLAEILTAAALEPDAGPHEEFCGSCTACLDECPTQAFVGPGVLDANLCISYWTIEHRGAIPESMREGLGDWLFGCDICQDVCPWNLRFARPRIDAMLGPREDLDDLDPAELLALDEATFRARFSGTPLMRAKWQGMRRNACVVLGNRRSPDALAALGRVLDDSDELIREHAAWAIGCIGGVDAVACLESALLRPRPDPERAALIRARDRAGNGDFE